MKKAVIFLLLIATGWSIMNGQKYYLPIQPYNESGYSVSQFETFALNKEQDQATRQKNECLAASYRRELIMIVNNFLRMSGLSKNYNKGVNLDETWIPWIFSPERTWPEHRVYSSPTGFWNSHQSKEGKQVIFYVDKNNFDGMIMTLHLENYELDLGKTICLNLVKVPFIIKQEKQEEKPIVEKPKAPEIAPTQTTPNITIIINNNSRSNEGYGNNQGYMVSDIERERLEMLGYTQYVPVYSYPVTYAFGRSGYNRYYGGGYYPSYVNRTYRSNYSSRGSSGNCYNRGGNYGANQSSRNNGGRSGGAFSGGRR